MSIDSASLIHLGKIADSHCVTFGSAQNYKSASETFSVTHLDRPGRIGSTEQRCREQESVDIDKSAIEHGSPVESSVNVIYSLRA